MTIARYTETYTRPASAIEPVTVPTHVDLETRLSLASAAMNAIMAHHHGDTMNESQNAVQDALDEAQALTPEPITFEPHPVLAKARRIIEQRGWARGIFQDNEGAVCARHAIRLAVYGPVRSPSEDGDPAEDDAVLELLNRIAVETGNPATSIQSWNDFQNDKEAVLKLLY